MEVAVSLDLVETKVVGGKALSIGVVVFGAGVACFYMALRKEELASGIVPAPSKAAAPERKVSADQAFVRNLYGTKAPTSRTPDEESAPKRKDLGEDQKTCPSCEQVVSRYAEQCPKCKERLSPS
jgi:hypothetical protein